MVSYEKFCPKSILDNSLGTKKYEKIKALNIGMSILKGNIKIVPEFSLFGT